MRKFIMMSLVAAQVAAVQPAVAADFGEAASAGRREAGAFAGARLRLPLGGSEKVRAGLMVAPIVQDRRADGRIRMGFGEGVEFGIAGRDEPGLSIAGLRLRDGRLAAAQEAEKDEKDKADKTEDDGISTLGIIGIVAGGVVVAGGIAFAIFIDALNDASE